MLSERKLKGLLAPTPTQTKQPLYKPIIIKKSASPSPSPTAASNSHKNTPNHSVPLFYGIPGVQNFFYHPFPQNDPIVQPSPCLEPFKLQSLKEIPLFSHASAHTAADSRGDQTRNHIQMDNDCSNSLCSLVKKLDLRFPSQPKNLEELLQRSFASMPSYSALQSPMGPAFASPFIRPYTPKVGYQGGKSGSISDLSFRGSFGQKSSFSGSQILKQKTVPPTDDGLIVQIAELISKENGGRIKDAITDLLSQYGAINLAQTDKIDQLEIEKLTSVNQMNANLQKVNLAIPTNDNIANNANEGASKPATISLSSGLTMNALNRGPTPVRRELTPTKPKQTAQNQNPRVEAARKELFILSEFDEKKSQAFPSKQTETNDFNLFDFTHGPAILNHNQNSPLISSAPLLRDGLGNLMNQPISAFTSHSTSQQAASLSTNSSHSENQKGIILNKKIPFELTGKFQVSNTFRLIDDIPLQTKILDVNFTTENWNKTLSLNPKNPEEFVVKPRVKNANKKLRARPRNISVEEYVHHVQSRSIEISNLTIEEDEEDWSDEEPTPTEKKKARTSRK